MRKSAVDDLDFIDGYHINKPKVIKVMSNFENFKKALQTGDYKKDLKGKVIQYWKMNKEKFKRGILCIIKAENGGFYICKNHDAMIANRTTLGTKKEIPA